MYPHYAVPKSYFPSRPEAQSLPLHLYLIQTSHCKFKFTCTRPSFQLISICHIKNGRNNVFVVALVVILQGRFNFNIFGIICQIDFTPWSNFLFQQSRSFQLTAGGSLWVDFWPWVCNYRYSEQILLLRRASLVYLQRQNFSGLTQEIDKIYLPGDFFHAPLCWSG